MNQTHHNGSAARASFVTTLLAATFLMGSSFVAGKTLLHDGFPSTTLVGWRFLVAALATAPLVYLDGKSFRRALLPRGIGARGVAIVVLIGLLQTTAVMGLLFLAMRSVSAATAAILLFTNPIWVAWLGYLFLNERLHRVRAVGLGLGVSGVVFAVGAGQETLTSSTALAGEGIALASAFCWALATIINKRTNLPLGAWGLSFWQMLIGAIALLTIAFVAGERWPADTTPAQWGWFLWLSIPASTGSFGLWFVALRKGGATLSSAYLFLAPLFAVLLSFAVLGTTLSWLQVMGGALIGVALWLISRESSAND